MARAFLNSQIRWALICTAVSISLKTLGEVLILGASTTYSLYGVLVWLTYLSIFVNFCVNRTIGSKFGLKLTRGYMFIVVYCYFKILNIVHILPVNKGYLFKLVSNYRLVVCLFTMVVFSGHPLILLSFYWFLISEFERETRYRVFGGGKGKAGGKKFVAKSDAKGRKKFATEDYIAQPDGISDAELNTFQSRVRPGHRSFVSPDTNDDRRKRFDHISTNRSNVVIDPGSYLITQWRDPTFTFGGDKDKFHAIGFCYELMGVDGNILQWQRGNNTCLFDCLFGIYCKSVNVRTKKDFDCALNLFNMATVKVTRACLADVYGADFRIEYTRWLNNNDELMNNDLVGPLCIELFIQVIAIWNGHFSSDNQQIIMKFGDRGTFSGSTHINLINGVITNIREPAHFSIVEGVILSSKYREKLPTPAEITIEDFIWNFTSRGIYSHFMWTQRPKEKKLLVIPDVASDLKTAPRSTRVVPTITRSTTKTMLKRELSGRGVESGETTRYSCCEPELDTSAIDALFSGKPVDASESSSVDVDVEEDLHSAIVDVSESTEDEESTGDESSVTEPPSTSKSKSKPLTIVTSALESVLTPEDRFVGVTGMLTWNTRYGVPSLLLTEREHCEIFKFLFNLWGDSGLTGMVYASQVVRSYIDMTHKPKWFFNNTRKWTRLVKIANYLGTCGSIEGYFTKMVEARKKIEGNNVMIDNPKVGMKNNSKFFNRKVNDVVQWAYYKTVGADEVYDYAAGVNQIHDKQILYSANLIEYNEVDWSDPEELRRFIADLSLNMRAVPLRITRYYVPYTKKFTITLYKQSGGYWSEELRSLNVVRKKVKCYVDIYGRRMIGHNYDENFKIIEKGPLASPVMKDLKEHFMEVGISDWDELYEFEKIMLLGTLSSSYRATTHNFMFDMGITVELCSPKVFSGSNTFQGISDRIDTVASSVCSKFHTNKLTAQYGVTLELNSIRIAKCIAKSYVEKLENKQFSDELPPEMIHETRLATPQMKNLNRVFGNGVQAVNRCMKSIVGYNTDEISDMPKMKPTVNNFKIAKSEDQHDCNPTVRKITAVTNYNVFGCLSPIPNTGNANNVREAFIKRIGCAVPEPCEAVKVLLPAYMEHFINCFDLKGKVTQTLVGEIERYMNWETYRLTLRYDPCRLKELDKIRKEVDTLSTFDFNIDSKEGKMLYDLWTTVEAHVKWESYKGEMKYARMIFARVDWFKVMFGSYAKITQQVIYETLPQFCATNLAVRDLPKHMVEKYKLCALILSTDFSAFEGHNYPWIMYNVFFKFLISIWGIEFDIELFICMGVMTSTNKIVNVFVWCNIDAKVMSGEVWTSICNWITNVILISFIVECEGFCFNTGFFSHEFSFRFFRGSKLPPKNTTLTFTAAGDDGMTGLPLLPWIDYSVLNDPSYLEIYGVLLKLEMKDGIAGSGFLSKVYSEKDMQTLCDPIKQLAKGILPIKYANSKVGVKKALARARAMSLLYEFGSCPVVAAYARCIIRCTRNVQMTRALINLKKDDWYSFEKVMEAVRWYEENEKGKYDKIDEIGLESRLIVEDSFGIPTCTQLVIERYFNETDDTSYPIEFNVPCIDLVCPRTECEFYEKYTFPRKDDDRSLTVCVNYVPERPVIESVSRTDSDWFDFLNRNTSYVCVAPCA